MAAHWWWSWGIGLNNAAYQSSGFVLSTSGGNIAPSSTTVLFAPVVGSLSPTDEFTLRVTANSTIRTPLFAAVTEGWLIFRWHPTQFGGTHNAPVTMQASGNPTLVELRMSNTIGATHLLMSLHINGGLVGTASETICAQNANYVFAIDFDLGAAQPEAGLVIDGVRMIARDNTGAGSPTSMVSLLINSGHTASSGVQYGDIAIFNSLSDLNDRSSQDVWVTFLDPDASTDGDNSWTPSAGTDLTAVNDANTTTLTSTTTSPDTITYGFESCNTRKTGWDPQVVYGVAAIAYAAATTQTDTTLTLNDLVPASAGSTNVTLTSTNTFIGVWTSVDSAAAAWTTAKIDGSTAIYSVV